MNRKLKFKMIGKLTILDKSWYSKYYFQESCRQSDNFTFDLFISCKYKLSSCHPLCNQLKVRKQKINYMCIQSGAHWRPATAAADIHTYVCLFVCSLSSGIYINYGTKSFW